MSVGTYLAGKRIGKTTAPSSSPSFQRLTFSRGSVWTARFAPDGQNIVYSASFEGRPIEMFRVERGGPESRSLGLSGAHVLSISPGKGRRIYVEEIESEEIHPLTPELSGLNGFVTTPDGKHLTVIDQNGKGFLYPVEGGEARPLSGLIAGDHPVRWDSEGEYLFLIPPQSLPAQIYRLEIASGMRELWNAITPPDPAGVSSISSFVMTPDGKTYAYSYLQRFSNLYLVTGLP